MDTPSSNVTNEQVGYNAVQERCRNGWKTFQTFQQSTCNKKLRHHSNQLHQWVGHLFWKNKVRCEEKKVMAEWLN